MLAAADAGVRYGGRDERKKIAFGTIAWERTEKPHREVGSEGLRFCLMLLAQL